MNEITEPRAALFRLARELRYRPLPIIGQVLVIESLDHVEHSVRQLVTPWITRDSVWDGCDTAAGLAKYGLVDRWCTASPHELDDPSTLRGVPALRATGFAADPTFTEDERALAEGCIVELANSLEPCLVKVFLNDRLPDGVRMRRRLPADYFPRPFVVTDACITNAAMIWIGKHFYL